MANIKTTIGSQGVVSSQTPIGTNPTLTVSVPLTLTSPSGSNIVTSTVAVTDLYVSDINGSDANSGVSSSAPLKTFAAAVAKIPSIVKNDIVIHLGAHGGSGYTWATIDNCTLLDGARIYVHGDGAGQSGEPDGFNVIVGSTAALGSSTDSVVKSTGLTPDAYYGFTIEILTGAAAGDRRTIKENTTTDIVPTAKFTAAIGTGDTYRIVQPTVNFTAAAYSLISTVLCINLGPSTVLTPVFPVANIQRSALVLVNLIFNSDVSIETMNSVVYLFGTDLSYYSFASSGEVGFGVTGNGVALATTLVTSSTSWHGWCGLTNGSFPYLNGPAYRYGVSVVNTSLFIADGRYDLYGGRIKATTDAGLWLGGNGATLPHCYLGSHASAQPSYLGMKISTTSGACIRAQEAKITCPSLGSVGPLVLTSSTGTGVLIEQNSMAAISMGHNFAGGFSLTTGGWGVSVKHGSKIYVDHDMSGYVNAGFGAFTLDELTAYPAIGGTGVSGSIDNKYLIAQDGSAIISID